MKPIILSSPESQSTADGFLKKIGEAIAKAKNEQDIIIKVMSDNYPEVTLKTYRLTKQKKAS